MPISQIVTNSIADSAVVTVDIANAAVTPAKLSTGAPSWDSAGVLSFNSGYGSAAVAYACRAWVNFNGTGTVAIRASGNITSITDNGTGDYTVNFTTAMPDANYSVATSTGGNINPFLRLVTSNIVSASALRMNTFFSANNTTTVLALADFDPVCISVFR
jgi:hypothetical protein